jgi:hypothetical protein
VAEYSTLYQQLVPLLLRQVERRRLVSASAVIKIVWYMERWDKKPNMFLEITISVKLKTLRRDNIDKN